MATEAVANPGTAHPRLNPILLITPVEMGYIAYDPASDRLHELNPIGALIAELCDGTRTIAQVRELVAPLLPEGKSDEVERWIHEAAKSDVIVFDLPNGDNQRELSAEELADIAFRLWNNGKIRTAYLCQKRVVELLPEPPINWYNLAEMAYELGRRSDAREAYEKYLEMKPEDAEVRHMLVALRDQTPPPRMPNDAIQYMYKQFAPTFEANLITELRYRGPEGLEPAIDSAMGERRELAVLDMGCGSGLAGVRFKPRAARLVGIDLSPEMLELARARNIYDHLEVAEVTDWLNRSNDAFDLVVSTDCLIYFGDLRQAIVPAARLLLPGGALAFTLERGDHHPFRLQDSGRYAHHPDHVREAAADAGLRVVRMDTNFLRSEYGVEVTGLFVVLQR